MPSVAASLRGHGFRVRLLLGDDHHLGTTRNGGHKGQVRSAQRPGWRHSCPGRRPRWSIRQYVSWFPSRATSCYGFTARFGGNHPLRRRVEQPLQKPVLPDEVFGLPTIPHQCSKQFIGCGHRSLPESLRQYVVRVNSPYSRGFPVTRFLASIQSQQAIGTL